MNPTRRQILAASASAGLASWRLTAAPAPPPDLAGSIGITTGSFTRHLCPDPAPGKLVLLDLPARMRNELDMKVIDLMTATLASMEPAYLLKLRDAAEKNGCVLTNLKMNNKGLDLGNEDPELRRRTVAEYCNTIDAAAILGVRWVRPLPGPKAPRLDLLVEGCHRLMDYAAAKNIRLLVENYGWMQGDPESIPRIIAAVGRDLKAQPDTGNWTDAARYQGLARAFPHAVSCDFKARDFDAAGNHKAYDLKRCFDLARAANFRGPFCIEHFHNDLDRLWREMAMIRDLLRGWMK